MSGRRVLVIGGSGQGRQAIDVLEAAGEHEVVGVLDRGLPVNSKVCGYPVLARDDDVATGVGISGADGFLVAIGDNFTRARVVAATFGAAPELELVCALHPAAVVARDAIVGPGAIVMAGAVISNGCVVGAGALIGTNASVDHDCTLGDFVTLAPGSTTGGDVTLADGAAVLLGANVIHGRTIGEHTVVGAGALVLGDLPDHVVAFGVPAEVVRTRRAEEPYL